MASKSAGSQTQASRPPPPALPAHTHSAAALPPPVSAIVLSMSAKRAKREPTVAWFQRRGQLTLVLTCSNAPADPPPTVEVAAEELRFSWGPEFEIHAPFLKPVDPSSVEWHTKGVGKVQISMRKAESGPHWRTPFQGGKRGNVKPDWDRWVEEEDDEEDEMPPIPIDTQLPVVYDGDDGGASVAMEVLDIGSIDGADRLTKWAALTMPQRMLTMALMWNSQSQECRLASVQRLVDLLRSAGGELAALDAIIKGGQGTLRSLDTSVYSKEQRSVAWVDAFGAKPAEQQVELLAELFMHLPADEQRMVVGSLA